MNLLRGTELKRFLRRQRIKYQNDVEISLVLQSVSYPVNVGSLFRIADSLSVNHLYLCGRTPTPPHPTIEKVGRGKHKVINWSYHENTDEVLTELNESGYYAIALELTDQSVPYFNVAYPPKIALVLGNEDHGVTRQVLAKCNFSIFVPMLGQGRSLNVHVSAAVALSHVRFTSTQQSRSI